MESADSSTAGSLQLQLPPGFRFHPTDEELIVHYLKKKAASERLPVAIIAEVDIYKFDPWELPGKAAFGEQEWYFFTPRDRKYPNGARPNRAATSGYWKATGTDKPVLTSGGTQKVAVKKALVFYGGKPPKGIKTNWIMHEYRLTDNRPKTSNNPPGCDGKKVSLRLDDWVLCRIYKKNSTQRPTDHDKDEFMPPSIQMGQMPNQKLPAGILLGNEHYLFDEMLRKGVTNDTSKRTLPQPTLYWTEHCSSSAAAAAAAGSSSTCTKRFVSDNNSNNNDVRSEDNGSIATLLCQLPQTPTTLHQQAAMLGSLNDGMFRQPYQLPGMNWYT